MATPPLSDLIEKAREEKERACGLSADTKLAIRHAGEAQARAQRIKAESERLCRNKVDLTPFNSRA
jgi:hypothetical protein